MAITFLCPACGGCFRGKEEEAGRSPKCPKCGAMVRVSAPDFPEAVPSESTQGHSDSSIPSTVPSLSPPNTVANYAPGQMPPTPPPQVRSRPAPTDQTFRQQKFYKMIDGQFDFAFTDDGGVSHQVSIFTITSRRVPIVAIVDGSLVVLRGGEGKCSYKGQGLQFNADVRRKVRKLRCGQGEFDLLTLKESNELDKSPIHIAPLGPRNELVGNLGHNMTLKGVGRTEGLTTVRPGMKPLAMTLAIVGGLLAVAPFGLFLRFLESSGTRLGAIPSMFLFVVGLGVGIGAGRGIYSLFKASVPQKSDREFGNAGGNGSAPVVAPPAPVPAPSAAPVGVCPPIHGLPASPTSVGTTDAERGTLQAALRWHLKGMMFMGGAVVLGVVCAVVAGAAGDFGMMALGISLACLCGVILCISPLAFLSLRKKIALDMLEPAAELIAGEVALIGKFGSLRNPETGTTYFSRGEEGGHYEWHCRP